MHTKDPINHIASKRIHKLNAELANQIAAGEVVERPASILKELLENSLDAGSTQIDISIEKGGLGLIRVQDNGHGICKEDLELALSQHATSKILSLADLEGVASFGFRGEALASISAVSRLSLSSCTASQNSGFCIQKSGRNNEIQLSVCPPILGTLVEVRDIFYNTPARRKFLRSEKTESLYIEECFKRIALSKPSVSFSLRIDARPPRKLVACKTLEAETRRVAELAGPQFIKNAQFMEAESNGLKIRGWLGSPTQLRAQADLQYFYVNDRSVKDKVVSYALRQAYQEYQLAGRYPAYVLFFELDPEAVDVNVHPTKHEVRFREVRSVSAFLIYSVRQALHEAMSMGQLTIAEPAIETIPFPENQIPQRKNSPASSHMEVEWEKKNIGMPTWAGSSKEPTPYSYSEMQELSENPNLLIHKPLSILNNEFLVCENNLGLLIVNIQSVTKALNQKMLNEALYGTLSNNQSHSPADLNLKETNENESAIQSKPLLMPVRIELKEISALDNIKVNFKQLGFSWSQIGPNSLLIRQVPFVMKTLGTDFDTFFIELLKQNNVEQAIEFISDYVARHTQFEFTNEKIESFMNEFKTLVMEDENKKKNNFDLKTPLYKQLTLNELRC